MEKHSALAEQLEGVLAGVINLEALLDEPSWFGGSAHYCYHGLWHFAIDEHMRRDDPQYAAMQLREMRKLIVLLRDGAGREQLEAVHFRGPSK